MSRRNTRPWAALRNGRAAPTPDRSLRSVEFGKMHSPHQVPLRRGFLFQRRRTFAARRARRGASLDDEPFAREGDETIGRRVDADERRTVARAPPDAPPHRTTVAADGARDDAPRADGPHLRRGVEA